MDPLAVVFKGPALFEHRVAYDARVGFRVPVAERVAMQIVALPERFAALRTGVGPFARMLQPVSREAQAQTELGTALHALEREVLAVRPQVDVQGSALGEPLSAAGADVRAFACVDAQMLLQVLRVREVLRAEAARVAFQPLVGFGQMALEAVRRSELLAAHVAHARPLARVDALVEYIRVRGTELLVAYTANVVDLAVYTALCTVYFQSRFLVQPVLTHVPRAQVVVFLDVCVTDFSRGLLFNLLGVARFGEDGTFVLIRAVFRDEVITEVDECLIEIVVEFG